VRKIVVAGAGIGGLTAALALAQKGFAVALLDKADKLEETGAGIQLSPNATRVLCGLGLRERLMPAVVTPEAVIIKTRRNREIARLRLGAEAERRYGAPYWMIHRGDLQAALLDEVRAHPAITLALGTPVGAVAIDGERVTLPALRDLSGEDAIGLVGADGLWSRVRSEIGETAEPAFARRTAWRALVPADAVAAEFRAATIHLWLGRGSHLVHYPVKGGRMINIVAIAADPSQGTHQGSHQGANQGWSTAATADDVMARFSGRSWHPQARDLLALPAQWLKWPLYDIPPLPQWGRGPVTLLGDAAHAMLPFLAQGAAMAIEDAAVLAQCIGAAPEDVAGAMRRYEQARRPRTTKVWRAARRNDAVYHLGWPAAAVRDLVLRRMGSEGLLARYDWIYDWRTE
jgi:salicylate hydroxylase